MTGGKLTQQELSTELIDWIKDQSQHDTKTATYHQTFVATEGQSVFTISGEYVPNAGRMSVFITGVKQISGLHYSETNSNTVNLAEGVPAGTLVELEWLAGAPPESSQHAYTHEVGGTDEIDITKLSGYEALDKRITDAITSAKQIQHNVKDYGALGDGVTDDAPAIQSVLDKALSSGGIKVYIPSGTYVLKSTLYVYSNTEIEMANDTVLLRGADTGAIFYNADPETSAVDGYNGHSNISIKNGTFDMNIANFSGVNGTVCGINHCKNLKFEGVTFKNLKDNHALDINATDGLIVRGCKFLGFRLTDPSRNYVEAIQLDICAPESFPPYGAWDRTETKNVIIEGCLFAASTTEGSWPVAIGAHGAVHDKWNNNIIIKNNRFEGCTYSAIRPYKWSQVLIEGNIFHDCSKAVRYSVPTPNTVNTEDKDGVQSGVTQSGSDINIVNNFVYNCLSPFLLEGYRSSDGSVLVLVNRIIIQGNTAYGTSTDSNLVTISQVKDVTIADNVGQISRRLLYASYSEGLSITGNKSSDTINHIYLFNCKGATVSGNIGQGCDQHGVRIEACKSINVNGNTLMDCSLADSVYHGIYVFSASDLVLVNGNVITEDSPLMASAVNISSDSTNCTQSNNLTNVGGA